MSSRGAGGVPLWDTCGSPLAHASLAAREYGIPSVVGTGNATARLEDGRVVLVDGNTGLVEVLSLTGRRWPE
jgi:rifampicin phosphotransferase